MSGAIDKNMKFYMVTLANDRWTIVPTKDRKHAIESVKNGTSEAYFEDLLEASRYAEILRARDGQMSHRTWL